MIGGGLIELSMYYVKNSNSVYCIANPYGRYMSTVKVQKNLKLRHPVLPQIPEQG